MRTPQPVDVAASTADVRPGPDGRAVLGDLLQRTRNPLEELTSLWHRLEPQTPIVMTVRGLKRSALRPEDRFLFGSQTLQYLLFRGGFEAVTVQRQNGGLVASARRSVKPPPVERKTMLSIIMPAFNEREAFQEIFEQVYAKTIPGVDIEIVIIESNSTDGTRDLVTKVEGRPRVRTIYEDRPRGKGHAVRAGLDCVTGDFVLIQDADLEYDVNDYDVLVDALVTGRAAFVLGSRHAIDGHSWKMRHFSDQVFISQVMNVGHVFFTALFDTVYGVRLRDPFTMFKVFRRDCLYGLTFESNRFDFDWELVGKLVRAGYAPLEIPVNYASRSFAKGKKVSLWRDPWTYFRACFKYRFVRLGK